jgi:hypothetical protein
MSNANGVLECASVREYESTLPPSLPTKTSPRGSSGASSANSDRRALLRS